MENTTVKTPLEEPENDNPLARPTKPSPYSNGVLKLLHAPHAAHAPSHAAHAPQVPSQYKEFPISHAPTLAPPLAPHAPLQLTEYKKPHALNDSVTYKECLKNHAAAMGGHAVDGCGEYMPSPNSLMCAACNCHRNFHRRISLSPPPLNQCEKTFMPLHRHHPPPPSPSASPPPISSSYAPHMLLALSSQNPNHHNHSPSNPNGGNMSSSGRKRFRTKFTHDQKEKMYEFAGKLSWKMQRRDEDVINEFCNGIGVDKGVFKVWMHNNKNTLGKKESGEGNNGNEKNGEYHGRDNGNRVDEVSAHPTNGSSSSC